MLSEGRSFFCKLNRISPFTEIFIFRRDISAQICFTTKFTAHDSIFSDTDSSISNDTVDTIIDTNDTIADTEKMVEMWIFYPFGFVLIRLYILVLVGK